MKEVIVNFPENNPFRLEMHYDGKTLPEFSPEELSEIIKYEPDYAARIICQKLWYAGVLKTFFCFSIKYPVLRDVLAPKGIAKNILLLNLLEDAARQNIADFCDMATRFIRFIDKCQGQYSKLFKRGSQKLLIEVLTNGNRQRKSDYKNLDDHIEQTRDKLFCKFNDRGIPTNESFTNLKEQVELLRKPIKDYRDTICAHADSEKHDLSSDNVDEALIEFKKIIFAFDTVLSFQGIFSSPVGPGIDQEKTVKLLNDILWSNNLDI